VSCRGILTWATVHEAVAPDGEGELQVQVRAGKRLHSQLRPRGVGRQHDCPFVDGTCCGSVQVAYDLRQRRAVDFGLAEPWLRSSIARSYGVTADELGANQGDVFQWGHVSRRRTAAPELGGVSERFPLA
jgi:hypothetical protein